MTKHTHDYPTIAYRENPTIATYVFLRRRYPDRPIQAFAGDGLEWVSGRKEFEKFDISVDVAFAAVDGECAAISELSLCLMELLIERDRVQKAGKSHAVSRGDVISDVFVNTLISYMLAGLIWHDDLHVNPDLMMLITHQLAGGAARQKKNRTKILDFFEIMDVALHLKSKGVEPSYRAIAKVMGVAATTVMRSFSKNLLDPIKAGVIRASLAKSPEAQREWCRGLGIATELADHKRKLSPMIISDALGLPRDEMFNIPDWDLLSMVEKGVLRLGIGHAPTFAPESDGYVPSDGGKRRAKQATRARIRYFFRFT